VNKTQPVLPQVSSPPAPEENLWKYVAQVFLPAECHPATSVKALKETQSIGFPHPPTLLKEGAPLSLRQLFEATTRIF